MDAENWAGPRSCHIPTPYSVRRQPQGMIFPLVYTSSRGLGTEQPLTWRARVYGALSISDNVLSPYIHSPSSQKRPIAIPLCGSAPEAGAIEEFSQSHELVQEDL